MVGNNRERTKYDEALGWKKVTQKWSFKTEAQTEQFFIFYMIIPMLFSFVGGVGTYFLWNENISMVMKFIPVAGMLTVGLVVGYLVKNKGDVVHDSIIKEAEALKADEQLAGAKRVSPKKYTQDFPFTGESVRFEQKSVYRRQKNLMKKVDKKGNVTYITTTPDQHDIFEPVLYNGFGLCIKTTKVLTEKEQDELRIQRKHYGNLFDEVDIQTHEDVVLINIDDEKTLKEYQIEVIKRADVFIPLNFFRTHMFIQGRAGSGKSVLYNKFYRATIGIKDYEEDEKLFVKPESNIVDYALNKGYDNEAIKKVKQDAINALKCKNVIIDTKGDTMSKYYRGDFVIKNEDGTEVVGKDIIYAGGLDERSIPYNFAADLLREDGTIDRLAVNNFAESIFKTQDISSDAEKFWAVNGKNVLRASIVAIVNKEGELTNTILYSWLKSDRLVDLIKDDKEAKRIAGAAVDGKHDSERILGILSGITEKAIFLEWVATERESKGTFSFKKWFNDGVPGTLFLVATDEVVDILMPLYGVITSFMLESIFTRNEDKYNMPVYWYGDEMPKMGKIAGIEKGLTFGRSKELRMFPGIQHNIQLEDIYDKKAKSIAEGAGQRALFAQGGPEAAKFCSAMVGTSRMVQKNSGVRMDDNEEHTQNESRDNQYTEVLDSEFMFMAPTEFILTGEYSVYTKISLNFHKIKKMKEETEPFKLTLQEAEQKVEKKRFGKEIEEEEEDEFELSDDDF